MVDAWHHDQLTQAGSDYKNPETNVEDILEKVDSIIKRIWINVADMGRSHWRTTVRG